MLQRILSCEECKENLPLEPRPVLQFTSSCPIMIVGQAPGIRVHETGIPWNDPSGDRLRQWLGLEKSEFYDDSKIAIVPMGFCYPGTGKGGDLPPRPECAKLWMEPILKELTDVEHIFLIGQYSQNYFLGKSKKKTLTETVKNWREYFPKYIVLPHPSPRNNIWLKKNPWFQDEVLPAIQKKIAKIL